MSINPFAENVFINRFKMQIIHETILYVDLSALEKNYRYLKKKLNSNTKIIAVVKAFAYGHGDIIIAKKLSELGVFGFWVADFEEGVILRKSGIKESIIVANPGSKSFDEVKKYYLEPVIYNFKLLDVYGNNSTPLSIHIKFNTGMNRYGFNINDINLLTRKLKDYSHLKVKSICSHLAVSNDTTKDDFTLKQFRRFNQVCTIFSEKLNIKPNRHILNTHGVLRFPQEQKEIVRLGIGLYGIGNDVNIKPISKLVSNIAQIRIINKKECVGYDASFVAKEKMKIAVVPLGYADGINRKLGDGNGQVLIKKTFAPIMGKISMDSFMIDISSISAKEGDTVIVFGKENSITDIAKNLNTIPYEILATLNRRIKRVYH